MKRISTLICSVLLCVGLISADRIYVDKSNFTLTYYNDAGQAVATYKIAVGKNYGQKRRQGDLKTPEGTFKVVSIENSSKWDETHNDWKGPGSGPYGPKFIRLKTPGFSGIGIHGTNAPHTIGTRCSEGCIRMHNEDVKKLSSMVRKGTVVEISADSHETYVAPKAKKYSKSSYRKARRRHTRRHRR